MAAQRFLALINGITTMIAANQVSAGAGDAGKVIALNSAGQLDSTMLPSGIGSTTVSATTSAAISAGMLVNFYNNAGVLTARPADSTTAGSTADGYATAAVTSGATGTFTLAGLITGLSSLTIGATYFLGTVGAVTTVVPSTAGNVVQVVGKAVSATSLEFAPLAPVTVA